jgi:galactoside O-acetyltransferase
MFLTQEQINKIGFKSIGENCLISDKATFHQPERISIGNNTRIDDYVLLYSECEIGNNVHIGCFCYVVGNGKLTMEDYSGLSGRVSIYLSNDDYGGEFMTNPTIPSQHKRTTDGNVLIKKHSVIGSGSIILPNVMIGENSAIMALSLVNCYVKPFTIYGGIPAKFKKERLPIKNIEGLT